MKIFSKCSQPCYSAENFFIYMFAKKIEALAKAASFGNIPQIRTLLTSGVNINSSHLGCTALWHAVSQNQFETVKYLIENGANVNVMDLRMSSPLYRAVGNNNFEIVEYLLQKGANVDKGTTDSTPLYIAIKNAHFPIIELLIQYKANTNKGHSGHTPISQAILSRDPGILVLLLDNGASIIKRDVEQLLKDKSHNLIIDSIVYQSTLCPPVRALSIWKLKVEYEKIRDREARHSANVLDHKLYDLSKIILPFYAKRISELIEAQSGISDYDLAILSQVSCIYPPYQDLFKPIIAIFKNMVLLEAVKLQNYVANHPDADYPSSERDEPLDQHYKHKLAEYLGMMEQYPPNPPELSAKALELSQLVEAIGKLEINGAASDVS